MPKKKATELRCMRRGVVYLTDRTDRGGTWDRLRLRSRLRLGRRLGLVTYGDAVASLDFIVLILNGRYGPYLMGFSRSFGWLGREG